MFCLVPKVLHNKSVNAIPSSYIHKLFQNSNYEIGDFLSMKVLHKIMDYNYNTLMYWQYIQLIFCLMQDAHTLYMDLSNLVSIQIKFNFFYN